MQRRVRMEGMESELGAEQLWVTPELAPQQVARARWVLRLMRGDGHRARGYVS
jgi:hypothetical protein